MPEADTMTGGDEVKYTAANREGGDSGRGNTLYCASEGGRRCVAAYIEGVDHTPPISRRDWADCCGV